MLMNKKGSTVIAKKILALLLVCSVYDIFSIYPLELNRFDYVMFMPDRYRACQLEFGMLLDGATNIKGRNTSGDHVNIMKTYYDSQDALAMIRGFDPNSEIGQLAAKLNTVNDDGVRGHIDFNAKMHAQELAFVARYFLPKGFYIDAFLPFAFLELKDLQYTDLTQATTFQDFLTREFLTKNLKDLVYTLGGLKLQNWQQSGFGDLVLQLGWNNNFVQDRPWLKNVKTSLYGGATFPTGLKRDEDLVFSVPFGYDGAYGVFLGGTLEVTWCDMFVGGVDVRFLHLFGHTKNRRIKTDANQTDILLLAKANAYLDSGIIQQYFLYLQARRFFRGMSFSVFYDHLTQHDDELFIKGLCYSSNTANERTQWLEGWSLHSLIFMLSYEWKNECAQGPRVSLFYRQGLNGKNALLGSFIGAEFNYGF